MSKLKIGSQLIDVRMFDNTVEQGAMGRYSEKESYIALCTEMNDSQRVITLFHEIFHALVSEYNLKLKDEERVVECLSRGIVVALCDNDSLLEIIHHEKKRRNKIGEEND